MTKLYSLPISPFASRVRISIYRKNIEGIVIVPPPGGPGSEAYRALTPIGQIPALEIDDRSIIPESAAIIEYLEDVFPEPSLRPADPAQRARARLFLRLPDIHFQNAPRALLRMRNPEDRDAAKVEAAFANLHRGLGYIEHYLDEGDWAVGGAASIADSALIPVLNVVTFVSDAYRERDLLAPYPKIVRYWQTARVEPIHARVIAEQNEARAPLRRPAKLKPKLEAEKSRTAAMNTQSKKPSLWTTLSQWAEALDAPDDRDAMIRALTRRVADLEAIIANGLTTDDAPEAARKTPN